MPSEIVLVATSEIVVHPVEFGVLAILVYRLLGSYSSIRWRYVLVGSLLFAIGYGLLDEFHQSFVPGRSSTIHTEVKFRVNEWVNSGDSFMNKGH